MENATINTVYTTENSEVSNNRTIDLVFLSSQTMGNSALELEILALFDQSAKKYLHLIETSTNYVDLPTHLHSLKGAAAGVGAKTIVEIIIQAEQTLQKSSSISSEMIGDIIFAISETREYIAQLTSSKTN